MPVTSHSIDHITCIACGQNIDADQFSINVHRQAHRQAAEGAARAFEVSSAAIRSEARFELKLVQQERDRLKEQVRDLRHFLRWLQDDIDELIGTKEGEEED